MGIGWFSFLVEGEGADAGLRAAAGLEAATHSLAGAQKGQGSEVLWLLWL